eukprot:gene12147-3578_t
MDDDSFIADLLKEERKKEKEYKQTHQQEKEQEQEQEQGQTEEANEPNAGNDTQPIPEQAAQKQEKPSDDKEQGEEAEEDPMTVDTNPSSFPHLSKQGCKALSDTNANIWNREAWITLMKELNNIDVVEGRPLYRKFLHIYPTARYWQAKYLARE